MGRIKNVLSIGVGVAIGWAGATLLSKGRDEAAIKAEESLKNTFSPENIGRNVGTASASLLAESARSFMGQLREEVPAFRQAQQPTASDSTQPTPDSQGTIIGSATTVSSRRLDQN